MSNSLTSEEKDQLDRDTLAFLQFFLDYPADKDDDGDQFDRAFEPPSEAE